MSRHHIRGGGLALLAVLAVAPQASAATGTFDGGQLTVTGTAAPETITVSQLAGAVVVTAPSFASDPDGAGGLCQNPTPTTVVCTDASVTRVQVDAAGGADVLTDTRVGLTASDRDVLNGDAGADVLAYSGGGSPAQQIDLNGGADGDTLTKNHFRVDLDGGADADRLFAGTDALGVDDTGGAGDDRLVGADQRYDLVVQEPGADTYRLGTRVPEPGEQVSDPAQYQVDVAADLIRYQAGGSVRVSLDDVAGDGAPGEGDDVGSDVEAIQAGPGDDVLTAGALAVSLQGGAGKDELVGGPGPDRLFGEDGDDVVRGGDGDDELSDGDFTSTSTNEPLPPAGADRLDGGPGDDVLTSDRGPDDLVGGAGRDEASFYRPVAQAPDVQTPVKEASFEVSLDDAANDGVRGAGEGDNAHADLEVVSTAGGDDVLTGTGGPERFESFGGADVITPGGGADTVLAGAGDDTVAAQDGATDRVDCGLGTDTAVADLAGGQPERADVLAGCESVSGVPFAALPGPVGGGGGAAAVDRTGPKVTLAGAKAVKAKAFRKGFKLTVRVGCDEACRVAGEVTTTAARAAKVGELAVGAGRLTAGTGTRTLTLTVAKTYRAGYARKLRRGSALRFVVRIKATDAAGNTTSASRLVRVKA